MPPKRRRTSAQPANKHPCNQTVPASDVDNSGLLVAAVSSASVEQLQLCIHFVRICKHARCPSQAIKQH